MRARCLLLPWLLAFSAVADAPSADISQLILEKYLSAQERQRASMKGVEMDVEIRASIPRLAKSGSLQALRVISKLGRITYQALRFEGDNTVKKDVIARYIFSEIQASENPNDELAITPVNYKFKGKGLQYRDAREVYVLELNPRRKAVGLFKGEVWLDPATGLPVRESGRLVKSPSVFIRKVEFVRDYEIREGVAIPTKLTSYADTRIVGRTELSVAYSNFHKVLDQVDPVTTVTQR